MHTIATTPAMVRHDLGRVDLVITPRSRRNPGNSRELRAKLAPERSNRSSSAFDIVAEPLPGYLSIFSGALRTPSPSCDPTAGPNPCGSRMTDYATAMMA